MSKYFYFLLYKWKKSIPFVKIFNFQFLKDLRVLGCPEHDLIITEKCPSVSVYVCVKNFVASAAERLTDRIS